jgi:hypothetical protein
MRQTQLMTKIWACCISPGLREPPVSILQISGSTYTLTTNAQIWPYALNEGIGGNNNSLYLVIQDIDVNSGSGMDFICGMTFLERFYTLYDTGISRLGLATTQFTIVNICCFVSELF